jgi:hypothetical protein
MKHSFFQDLLHLTPPAFIRGLWNIVSFRMYFTWLCPLLSTVYATRCLSGCTSSATPAFIGGLWNTIAFKMYFTWLRPLLSVVYATWCLSGCTSPDSTRFVSGLCNIVSFRIYFTCFHSLSSVVNATYCLSRCTSPDSACFYRWFMQHHVFQDVLHLSPPADICGLCKTVSFRMYFTWVHMLLSMIYVA